MTGPKLLRRDARRGNAKMSGGRVVAMHVSGTQTVPHAWVGPSAPPWPSMASEGAVDRSEKPLHHEFERRV